jgi:hypothetical protein
MVAHEYESAPYSLVRTAQKLISSANPPHEHIIGKEDFNPKDTKRFEDKPESSQVGR